MRIFLIAGASIGVLGTFAGMILGGLFVVFIDPIQDFLAFVIGRALFDPEIYYLYRLPARINWFELQVTAVFSFVMALIAVMIFVDQQHAAMKRRVKARARVEDQPSRNPK